jgi:hypothetical protein
MSIKLLLQLKYTIINPSQFFYHDPMVQTTDMN